MKFISKVVNARSASPSLTAKGMVSFATKHEAVIEYLTLCEYEEGSPRQVSNISMTIDEGRWRMCLNDKDNRRSMWVSGDTIEACLASLEARLASGGAAEWRYWKAEPQAAAGGGRPKKT